MASVPASAQVFPIPNTPQHVICDSGCGSPPANPDGSTFTAGVTNISLIGMAFNDALAAVTSGTFAAPRITAYRAMHINIRDAAGNELGTMASPLYVASAAGGGGLTDTELRATPVPVSVAGVATQATLATIDTNIGLIAGTRDVIFNAITVHPDGGAMGVFPSAGSFPVTGTFWQATQPVSGTFWQATQPVSGTVTATGPLTDTQLRASAVPVSGPVTDTQLRATPVPISGTVTVTDGAGALNVIVDSGTTTVTQGTGTNLHAVIDTGSTTAVTGNVTVVQATPANLTATVTPIAITKGTQGATGFTVQNIKDAGRTAVSITASIAAPTVADTVFASLIKNSAGTAAGAAQSIVAAGGKTLRITSLTMAIRTTTAATPWGQAVFRMSTTTTCTAASSVVAYLTAGGNAAVIGNTAFISINPEDGWELVSGGSFCISTSGNVTTNTMTFSAQGFEY